MKLEREFEAASIAVPTASSAIPSNGMEFRMASGGMIALSASVSALTVSYYANAAPFAKAFSVAADSAGTPITQALSTGVLNALPSALAGCGQIALIAGTAATATIAIKS